MFYRSYFPDDVDISVPYVAPLNKGVEDGRHEKFLQYQVSTKETDKGARFPVAPLQAKAALLPMFEKYCNDKKYVFNAPLAEILITLYSNTPLLFWQWGEDINKIPAREADDKTVFDYWINMCEPDYFTNYNATASFDVQAARELGYYGYYTKPFKKYLSIKTAKGYLKKLMVPRGRKREVLASTL